MLGKGTLPEKTHIFKEEEKMSTTLCNYYLQEIERTQSQATMDALAEGLETIPGTYYNRRETMEAVELYRSCAMEQIAVIATRAKVKALSSDKKWRPIMETIRADLKAIAPVEVVDDGEGRRRFRSSVFVSPLHVWNAEPGNKALDLIQTGVEALLEYSPERTFVDYHEPLPFVVESSMYYDNGQQKPSTKYVYRWRTALENVNIEISRFIEGHRTEAKKALETEVLGTAGRKYRRSNMLEAFTGNNDASEVVARYTNILSKEEALVFMHLYVNDHTREQTANELGLTKKSVEKAVERIKEKVIKAGLISGLKSELKEDNSGKEIDVYSKHGDYVGRFASIKNASEVLGVRRSHAQDTLAGRRKTAGGYVFSYVNERPLFDGTIEKEETTKKVIVFGHTVIDSALRAELIKAENGRYTRIKTSIFIPSVTDGEPTTHDIQTDVYFDRAEGRKLARLWEERRAEVEAWKEERKKAKPVTCGKCSKLEIIPAYDGKRSEGLKAVHTHNRATYDALVKEAYRRKKEEALKAYIEKYGE